MKKQEMIDKITPEEFGIFLRVEYMVSEFRVIPDLEQVQTVIERLSAQDIPIDSFMKSGEAIALLAVVGELFPNPFALLCRVNAFRFIQKDASFLKKHGHIMDFDVRGNAWKIANAVSTCSLKMETGMFDNEEFARVAFETAWEDTGVGVQ